MEEDQGLTFKDILIRVGISHQSTIEALEAAQQNLDKLGVPPPIRRRPRKPASRIRMLYAKDYDDEDDEWPLG